MKTIKYMGREYEVPYWANFIATDGDGEICVFEMMPDPYGDEFVGFWDRTAGRSQLVDKDGWRWNKTLVEIEE